jgi:hypothetical protein
LLTGELIRSRSETEAGKIFGFVSSPVKVETVHKKGNFFDLGVKKLVFLHIFFWSDVCVFFSGF